MADVPFERLRPSRPGAAVAFEAVVVGVTLAVLAASARASVAVPGLAVPVTLQSLVVLLVGAWMGPARGPGIVAGYLAAGALGLPVFADGASGLRHVVGPSAGYFAGFVLAAWLVGFLVTRGGDEGLLRSLGVAVAGTVAILFPGVAWLADGIGLGWERALTAGFWPHLPGAAIKAVVAALAMAGVRAAIR